MGTLSKRPLRDFGVNVREHLRAGVSHREQAYARKAPDKPVPSVSTPWLALAGASFVGAVVLKAIGRNHLSLFVGQMVPTFLLMGFVMPRSAPRSR